MQVFAASDIVQVAIRIEENGIIFYKFAEQLARQEEAKKLFAFLADAEAGHKRTFEKFFAAVDKYTPAEQYAGEYSAYLRNYVDNNIIFTKEVLDKQLAGVKDTVAAFDFAMQRELDSILYYHEVKNLVPAAQHDAIEKIIEEERKHYALLCDMKKRFTK